jgi:GNAT superfamily N-acetyltransferase
VPEGERRLDFRDMTEGDLADGLRLSRASGWNQTLEDWRLLLSLGPGLFRVATRDGAVVASGGAVRYGQALAWVCMILVHPDERGHGLGTRVFDEVLARCADEVAAGRLRCVGLDATPAGRGIYAQRGFLDGPELLRMSAPPPQREQAAPEGLRPLSPSDLEAVLARDRLAFGADRGSLLRWARERAPELAWIKGTRDRVAGYCFGRQGDHSDHVGTVVAEDRATALELVRACLSAPRRRPLILDARAEPSWLEALGELGFRAARSLTRMYRGVARPPAQPALEPAVFGPEFG